MVLRLAAGCLRRIFVLALLVGILAVGWRERDRAFVAWQHFRGESAGLATVSPAAADSAERKLASLAARDGPARVSLTRIEVQSLVEYRLTPLFPTYVLSPRVEFDAGRVRLAGRVPTGRIAPVGELDDLLGFLPDTTELGATGHLVPFERDRVALEIHELTAAKIPLPARMIPRVLESLGATTEPRLSRNAVALPLPPGARTAYVSGDSLVVVARDERLGSRP